ncbi:hypothetical protein ES319_D11G000400v1 [Gossypium barbadense]|uniref:Uncharacterized protein n=2 Tax=Gossypium TaxID=3633 RepID=A0A5J5P4G3_GOSBA|nr:hypothetical protein ES319_D11G000400v1 [Gossypium barbadense]TYG43241.1 hypothetical protein ES288_D11G000800v1 [Gossypium darwinii]
MHVSEEDVDIVVHHIHGVIESFWTRIEHTRVVLKKPAEAYWQDNFRIAITEAAKPFLLARTDRFVNELELFLASGLNIEAYDAVYMQRLGWNTSGSITTNPVHQVVPFLHIFDVGFDQDE